MRKKWFDSEATAEAARGEKLSPEAMVKLLSPDNLAVLAAVNRHHPASLRQLAALTGRKEASLARTLGAHLEAFGGSRDCSV
jgi:predicted transcriptional regulator